MERRNFLGVFGGTGIASVWDKLRATSTSYGSETNSQAPHISDRFHEDTGYNEIVVERIGAGKSYASKTAAFRKRLIDEQGDHERMKLSADNMNPFDIQE